MRSSRKPAILALGAAIGLVQALGAPSDPKGVTAAAPAGAPSGPDKKGAKPAKPAPKGAKGKAAPATSTDANDPNSDQKEDKITLPLPKGEPQHTVKFPLYGSDGALNYRFEMGVATLMDDDMVKMTKLRILSFKEDENNPGKRVPDMDMDLPDAFLNQKTKDLTSEAPITIKSENYEVTGKKMTFNLQTRQGTLGGGVKMVIYDIDKLSRGTKATPTVEVDSKKIELKK
jgi:hypothetical protein